MKIPGHSRVRCWRSAGEDLAPTTPTRAQPSRAAGAAQPSSGQPPAGDPVSDPAAAPETTANRSVAEYLAAVASGEPTPGGGSVVAVVAALGAALAEMVCSLTIGRAAYAASERELREARQRAMELRGRLLDLAGADEAAYGQYRHASGLPRGTDEERTERDAAIQESLIAAAEVPLDVAASCLALAELLEPVARSGNRHAVSDAVVGAHLADAASRGALLNVRTNARLMRDRRRAAGYLRRADELERRMPAAVARVLAAAQAREH